MRHTSNLTENKTRQHICLYRMPALQLGAVMLELVFCRFAISSVKQMLKHFGAGSIKAEQSRLIASKRLSELIQLC